MVEEEKRDLKKPESGPPAERGGEVLHRFPKKSPQGPQVPETPRQNLRAMQAREAAESAAEAAAAATIVKHVWTSEDTYASLAIKYYGSMKEPYWRLIYNHNKEIIGNHPNDIRVGLEIEIPPLPDELKEK